MKKKTEKKCPPASTGEEPSRWKSILRCMLLSRLTEERLIRLYHQGRIFGGVYTGLGQEAIGTATALAGEARDLFAPCIRNMTVTLGRGESALNVFRQYLGRASGPTRGRDGNVHYGNLENGVLFMISHLGAMLSVLTGAVMARRRQGVAAAGVAYIGDGASSTGDFHEAVNFAAVFDVPVIFVIENNKFAYSTPNNEQYRCRRLVDRAIGYGIEGIQADGNDVVELHGLARKLLADIRERPRPILLECDTLRMRGHGEHDDASYVPRELLEQYRARDPIALARRRYAAEGWMTDVEMDELTRACEEEVDRSYRQALAEPPPDPATLLEGVYADD
jgi:TPP-dependent pyruvate/acetoin dehydrogenase alpha subunit